MSQPSTFVSCLTPAGTGAIATIGLQGPDAWAVVGPLFPEARPAPGPGSFYLTMLKGAAGGVEAADRVVVAFEQLPAARRVLIHCHGGSAVVRWLLGAFRAGGAEEIDWRDWLRRTTRSRLEAEAAVALTQAPTLRAAGVLLDQYHGALEQAIRRTLEQIQAGRHPEGLRLLDSLLSASSLGLHLIRPWKVVLAGAANVGKSSLLNAILGYPRAITSPLPGTTRDRVTAVAACDGWPVEFIDTAGLRTPATELEAAGIEHAREAIAAADLVLWLVEPAAQARPIFDDRSDKQVVVNKIDLLPDRGLIAAGGWIAGDIWFVSAKSGEGLEMLLQRLGNRLVPEPPPPGTAVPFLDAQRDQIASARRALSDGDSTRAAGILEALL